MIFTTFQIYTLKDFYLFIDEFLLSMWHHCLLQWQIPQGTMLWKHNCKQSKMCHIIYTMYLKVRHLQGKWSVNEHKTNNNDQYLLQPTKQEKK
jgi:hypothetical protein